jgi:adenylylsulfate kinase
MRILVFGLAGSGKTTLSEKISKELGIKWYNADRVREEYNDWDFSEEGRKRQLDRMLELSYSNINTICDFICPLEEYRKIFNPDISIFMNTIQKSIYENTNKIFQIPEKYDIIVNNFDQTENVVNIIKNWRK